MTLPRRRKHLSLVLFRDQVISVGDSTYKSHPLIKEFGYEDYKSLHSEVCAYTRTPRHFRKNNLTLVNMRFNRYGDQRNSKPCPICSKWCIELFEDIFFTQETGIGYIKC